MPTPLFENEMLIKEDGGKEVDVTLYRRLVGLPYLTATNPDIMFSIELLTGFMHSPTHIYFNATK